MEFARFELPDHPEGPTALNLVPAHVVAVMQVGDMTEIVTIACETYLVPYSEGDVLTEIKRADAVEHALYTVAVESEPSIDERVAEALAQHARSCVHGYGAHFDSGGCSVVSCFCTGWPGSPVAAAAAGA